MSKTFRNVIQYLFFLGLGIFLLWWSAKDLNAEQRHELKSALAGARYILVIPAMFFLLLSHYSRAMRWKILMEPLGYRPSNVNTFFAVMTGYLFNLLVPRLGEVMKCTILGKYENVPADKLVGTIVAERAFDVISLIIVIALTILTQIDIIGDYASVQFRHFFLDTRGNFRFQKVFITIGIILVVFFLVRWLLNRFAHIDFVQKINAIFKGVWLGISSAKNINKKGWFIFHTIFIWIMYLASIKTGFYAMEPTSHLGIRSALSVLSFGSVAMIVTQGGIGAYQLAIQKLMPLYGINEADGLGFGWVLWAAQTAIVVIIGFLCLSLLPVFNRKKNEAV